MFQRNDRHSVACIPDEGYRFVLKKDYIGCVPDEGYFRMCQGEGYKWDMKDIKAYPRDKITYSREKGIMDVLRGNCCMCSK